MVLFKKATKHESKLRLALIGPSGSGKTYSALNIAKHLGGKVALIDTERGSASKYADEFEFDVLELDSFHPKNYIEAIESAQDAGYDLLIIDSLSHAWVGKGGALELVDQEAKKSKSGNSFTAWRNVTPLHNQLVDAMLQCKVHLIATMRSKTAYSMETDSRGKTAPKKIGMEPVQRDGVEYEFDVIGDMDIDNNMIVSKSRCKALTGQLIEKPGQEVAQTLLDWLSGATPPPDKNEAWDKMKTLGLTQVEAAKLIREGYGTDKFDQLSDDDKQELMVLLNSVENKQELPGFTPAETVSA